MNSKLQEELIYFFSAAFLFIILIAVIFKIISKKLKFDNNNIEFYGLLLNLNTTALISISAMTIQYILFIWCSITFCGINMIYLSMILLLALISDAVSDNFIKLPISIAFSLINCGTIHIVKLLFEYIKNEQFSILLLIIMILVIIFIFLYDTYNLLKSINNIVVKNKYLKNKKYNL